MLKTTKYNAPGLTLILIGLTTLGRFIAAAYTGLGTGEAYYYRGARLMELSYFDQPPLFFWLSGASMHLFGESNFALRLPTVLLFAGSSWLLYLITTRFYSSRAGFIAVLILNMSAVFSVSIGIWFQPDSPMLFFWLLTSWVIIKILFPVSRALDYRRYRTQGKTYLLWLLLGLVLGLSILSKYHILFLLVSVFVFCLTRKKHRHWLWHPGPYIAIVISLVVALPVFIWNAEHDWISFTFQASRAGKNETSLHFDWLLRSIGGQAMWILPWIWVPLIVQLPKLYRRGRQDEFSWFLFWISVLPIVFFTVITLWSDLQFHFHWQAPGYLMLMIPLAAACDRQLLGTSAWRKTTKRWLILSLGITLVAYGVLATHMTTGFWKSYGPKWFAQQFGNKTDPTIEGTDYVDIRKRFEQEGWMDKDLMVGTSRWWLSGKVDWVLRGEKDVFVLHKDTRNYTFYLDAKESLGKDAILLAMERHEGTVEWDMTPFFDEVTRLEDLWITRGGEKELRVLVYYGKNFHAPDRPMLHLPVYRQLVGLSPFPKKGELE